MINEQAADRGFAYKFLRDYYGIATASYEYKNPNVLFPAQAKINFQKGIQYVNMNKLSAEFVQQFKISKHKSLASVRLFAGAFLFAQSEGSSNKTRLFNQRASFRAGGRTGNFDYLYDESMIGRSLLAGDQNVSGIGNAFANQVLLSEAGFKNFANIGSTNTFLTAINLIVPAPIPLPIGIYTDIIYWQLPGGTKLISGVAGVTRLNYDASMVFTYNGGIYFDIIRDVATMYVPLFYSNDVRGYWDNNNFNSFLSRVSFSINLNKLSPIDMIRNLKL
jgi:hypothetical protein